MQQLHGVGAYPLLQWAWLDDEAPPTFLDAPVVVAVSYLDDVPFVHESYSGGGSPYGAAPPVWWAWPPTLIYGAK